LLLVTIEKWPARPRGEGFVTVTCDDDDCFDIFNSAASLPRTLVIDFQAISEQAGLDVRNHSVPVHFDSDLISGKTGTKALV